MLTIAIDAFSLKGFSAVSIRDITREAGMKESSFYNHYRSKNELLETIFANFRQSVERIMPPIAQLEAIAGAMRPGDFLRQGYRNFLAHVQSPGMEAIWRILYLEQCRHKLARDIYLNDVIGRTIDFLEAAFAIYIEHGLVRPLPARRLAAEYQYPLFGMIAEYLLLRLDGGDTAQIERSMAEHIEFFATIIAKEADQP
nr:TetR/AcrR family transcriptional regulator [Cohnella lubricantis]